MKDATESKTRRISSFFQQDHREIDAIMQSVSFDDPGKGLPRLQEFDRRLERHIRWEEEILFPAVEDKEPCLKMGPIAVMKTEHEGIRDNKAKALKALAAGNGGLAKQHAGAMLSILTDHNAKEEQILYPACDEFLSAKEAGQVLDQVRAKGGSR